MWQRFHSLAKIDITCIECINSYTTARKFSRKGLNCSLTITLCRSLCVVCSARNFDGMKSMLLQQKTTPKPERDERSRNQFIVIPWTFSVPFNIFTNLISSLIWSCLQKCSCTDSKGNAFSHRWWAGRTIIGVECFDCVIDLQNEKINTKESS